MAKKNDAKVREALSEQPERKKRVFLPFGCTMLDLVVGGGEGMGMPLGTLLNLVGDTSGGKSAVKNEFIASAYHFCRKSGIPFNWFSDDCESGDTFDTKKLYGVNLHPEDRKIGKAVAGDSRKIEGCDAQISAFLNELDDDAVGIYAIDSLDGLSNNDKEAAADSRMKQFIDGSEVKDKGSYDLAKNKFLSQQFFPTQANKFEDKNAILVVVSQTREKLNAPAFTDKMEPTGGKALQFYVHTRLVLSRVCVIKKTVKIEGVEKEIEIGAVMEAKTKKSKTPRPYRKCRFVFYFDYGIDEVGTNIDYLFDLRNDLGQLTPSLCKVIPWEQKKERSKESCVEWMQKLDIETQYVVWRKEQDGKKTFAMEKFMEWVGSDPSIETLFKEEFGITMTRDELVKLCDEDPEVRTELKNRVIARWEAFEAAARTDRPSKYSD